MPTIQTLRHRAFRSAKLVAVEIPALSRDEQKALSDARDARLAARQPPLDGLAFLKRLTPEEYGAILTAADSQRAAGNPQLALWIDMLRVNGSIQLNGADAIAAKAALVSAGLFDQARADVVFA